MTIAHTHPLVFRARPPVVTVGIWKCGASGEEVLDAGLLDCEGTEAMEAMLPALYNAPGRA